MREREISPSILLSPTSVINLFEILSRCLIHLKNYFRLHLTKTKRNFEINPVSNLFNKQTKRERDEKNGYPDHQQEDYALFIYNSKVQDLSDLRGS